MFGLKDSAPVRVSDEAEKPFWISFSDLMTALMVLFLVTVSVALVSVTKKVASEKQVQDYRDTDIKRVLRKFDAVVKRFGGKLNDRTVDFGPKARFQNDSDELSRDAIFLLIKFVPEVLAIARDPDGKKWLKRIVVDGYASHDGSYMHNLDLSIRRSERVLCILLMKPSGATGGLSPVDQHDVRRLFLVGGSSYNSIKETAEESRRVELRLEFFEVGEREAELAKTSADNNTSGKVSPFDNVAAEPDLDSSCPLEQRLRKRTSE